MRRKRSAAEFCGIAWLGDCSPTSDDQRSLARPGTEAMEPTGGTDDVEEGNRASKRKRKIENLEGIRMMSRLPTALVVDTRKEKNSRIAAGTKLTIRSSA